MQSTNRYDIDWAKYVAIYIGDVKTTTDHRSSLFLSDYNK